MNSKTKIFTVFVSSGYLGPGGFPESFITNQQVVKKLEEKFDDVDFVVKDLSQGNITADTVLAELSEIEEEPDGVLIFGTQRKEHYPLALTGLPTIVVYNLFEFMHLPYQLYKEKGKILTACLDRRNSVKSEVSESMFRDLIGKIELIKVLKKMKSLKIISISPHEFMCIVDYKHLPAGYNQSLINAMKSSLGIELIRVAPEEFYDRVKDTDEKEAEKIAKMWLEEAKTMEDTTEQEVIKSAKMYLAFKALAEKYNASAVTSHMRFLKNSNKDEDRAWPSLANTEFQKHGIQGLCQDYPHLAATHAMGYYLTGRPSMLGDIMLDPFNSVSIVLHCGAPVNPHGNERIPYTIISHAESPLRGTLKPGCGASSRVELPAGEPVTVWKIHPIKKKIMLHTGTSVDGREIYKNFDDIMCRTKFVVKTEAEKVQNHFYPDIYGLHRSAIYGDLREKIKNIGILTGFEVIEEDK
jgi:L-fucose isomerase-like protein